ncbi:helix-turn-helix domain-containing protein [Micromonospora sp. NPDC050980]|uniref:helix-turn-helix domain-containing protein n=1 Tax=Micromonospora sp. NPDC050980 TaxID=3155161 RepID=UPI0033F10CE7
MTGRPEKPLDPSGGPAVQFAAHLRRLRQEAGTPTYRTMASRSFYSVSTLSVAASGTRFPSWRCVEAYVRACGARDEDVVLWMRRWRTVHRRLQHEKQVARRAARVDAASGDAGRPRSAAIRRTSLPMLDVRFVEVGPSPVMDLAEYLVALGHIRGETGLSLRRIAARSRLMTLPGTDVSGGLTRSQLHEMLNGRAPLRPRHVLAYLLACGLPEDRAGEWVARLHQLHDQEQRAKSALTALKSGTDEYHILLPIHSADPQRPLAGAHAPAVRSVPKPQREAEVGRGKHRLRRPWTALLGRFAASKRSEPRT